MSEGLPREAIFDCKDDAFHVIDAHEARASILRGTPQPWMSFQKGPKNVIESTPRKVVSRRGGTVAVQCDDGVVYINFDEGNARKESAGKEWRYMGGIDRRNDGLGYIPSS